MHIADRATRNSELMAIYGILPKELQEKQNAPGSTINALPRGTYTAAAMQHGWLDGRLAPAGTGSLEALSLILI